MSHSPLVFMESGERIRAIMALLFYICLTAGETIVGVIVQSNVSCTIEGGGLSSSVLG